VGKKIPRFQEIIKKFNLKGIRYILIGRQAVVLHGAPLLSYDYDLWVHPEDRENVYQLLTKSGFEPSHPLEKRRPIVFFILEIMKMDVFFVRAFANILKFEECFQNSVLMKEEKGNFYIRVASINDLIKLKAVRKPLRPKDREDIEYLKKIKKISVKK
jgi:hypothetical protein